MLVFDVIVLDLDGTILKDNKTVSELTLSTLKKFEDMGKQIIIATARPPRLGSIELPEVLQKEFMLFYNGAEIHHNKKKIYSSCISLDSAEYIRNLVLTQYTHCKIGFELDDELYTNLTTENIFGTNQYTKIDLNTFKLKPVTKILLDMSSIDDINALRSKLPYDCNLIVTDKGQLGQIMKKGVSKLNGLNHILDKLNISINKTIFFGDDTNDIELINACGTGVAMGNAVTEVKQVADYVTLSNEEDGVAYFLNELI